MVVSLKLSDDKLEFIIGRETFRLSDNKVEKIVIDKIRNTNNGLTKVGRLFGDILSTKLGTQDLIDYHMDRDLDWNFITLCMKHSKKLTRIN